MFQRPSGRFNKNQNEKNTTGLLIKASDLEIRIVY